MGLKKETATYECLSCKHKFEREYTGWYPTTICPNCRNTAMYENMVGVNTRNTEIKPEMAAFGHDKTTGQPYWVDTKGKRHRHDSSAVRYDLSKDPRGWKAAGKKVRETDSKGNPNY